MEELLCAAAPPDRHSIAAPPKQKRQAAPWSTRCSRLAVAEEQEVGHVVLLRSGRWWMPMVEWAMLGHPPWRAKMLRLGPPAALLQSPHQPQTSPSALRSDFRARAVARVTQVLRLWMNHRHWR